MEVTYTDRIYSKLFTMNAGEEIILLQNVKPDNMPEFIRIVKEFIRYDNGRREGFYIEFCNDYSKIKKFRY